MITGPGPRGNCHHCLRGALQLPASLRAVTAKFFGEHVLVHAKVKINLSLLENRHDEPDLFWRDAEHTGNKPL